MQLTSQIRCPQCHFAQEETMPLDACQIVYQCSACGHLLRPKPGDCCVFCSYGSSPCPPKQQEQSANPATS
ncbi:MAG TPA: GDCCVxC domain-containing (seleno)protein [Ktedonobacterales bacterium]|jgi:rubredoxin